MPGKQQCNLTKEKAHCLKVSIDASLAEELNLKFSFNQSNALNVLKRLTKRVGSCVAHINAHRLEDTVSVTVH